MNHSIEIETTAGSDRGAAAWEDETANSGTGEATDKARQKRPPIWPFVLYFLFVAAAIAVIGVVADGRYAAMTLAASSAGLVGLTGVLAGLWGRCWIAGFWTAWLLAAAAVIGVVAAQEYRYQLSVKPLLEIIPVVFVVPTLLFALAAPHLLMRGLCGWRLDRRDRPFQPKQPVGLLELMALMTVLASVCFLLRVPLIIWQSRPSEYFMGIGISAAMLFALSMVLAVPAVKFAFRGRTVRQRRLLPAAIFLIGLGLLAAVAERMEKSSWLGIEWQPVVLIPSVATTVFVIGLTVLKAAGFGLTRNLPAADRRSVSSDVDAGLEPTKSRTLHVRWAAATLLVAIVTSVVMNVHVSRRIRQDEELAQLAERLRDAGGDLILRDRRPSRVEIGTAADIELLADLSRYDGLSELSLAGSKVDDEILRQIALWFPDLEYLDLGHTGVTANGLRYLQPLSNLHSLGLAGADLTIEQINDFVRDRGGLMKLDLSDSGLSAEELARLDSTVYQLAVRGLGLTDADLAGLQGRQLSKLDISGNPITGQGLAGLTIQDLTAHDVPLTDAGLQAFLSNANSSVSELVLSGTQLTDGSAPLLLSVQKLHLGDGTISEAAVEANATRIDTLGLHSRQFTGECLKVMGPQVTFLNLSGSGVTDQALIDLGESLRQASSRLTGLSLADTEVTDHGLRGLSGRFVSILDLRRTAVSAEAISQLEQPWLSVHLDVGQFTPQQLEMLRQHHTVYVGEKPWW